MSGIVPTNAIEPPGGLTLRKAFEAYLDDEQLGCWRQAVEAIDDHQGQGIVENDDPRRLDDEMKSLRRPLSALRQDLMEGVLVAWGVEGMAGPRLRVCADAWSHISIDGILASQLQRPGEPAIYQIRVYKAAEIAEWRQGVELWRAAELLDPQTYKTFTANFAPIVVIGSFRSMAERSRADEAQSRLREQLFALVDTGVLELRSLFPPGAPTAAWVSLSPDVLKTIDRGATHFSDHQKSQVQLKDGTCYPVSVFLANAVPQSQSEADMGRDQPQAGPAERQPVYTRVADVFDALPKDVRADVETRQGRQRIHALVQATLPDIYSKTLARELRRFLAELRKGGTQAGK